MFIVITLVQYDFTIWVQPHFLQIGPESQFGYVLVNDNNLIKFI